LKSPSHLQTHNFDTTLQCIIWYIQHCLIRTTVSKAHVSVVRTCWILSQVDTWRQNAIFALRGKGRPKCDSSVFSLSRMKSREQC
jgi:hypothetical protein